MKARFLLLALIVALLNPSSLFAASENYNWYFDVPAEHMHRSAVFFMTDNGYADGYEDNTFRPTDEINRAEALKMILEVAGVQLGWEESFEWPDVEADDWFHDYAQTAAYLGIARGNDDGYFEPGETVKRAEAIKMLTQAMEVELNQLELSSEVADEADEEIVEVESNWYDAYIAYAAQNALVTPDASYDYLPGQSMSRGELSELIWRFMEAPFTGETQHGEASYYADKFNGRTTASGSVLDTTEYVAAHLDLPFGTMVRVTNPATHASVDVEIVDRGPYVDGRIIDLTPAAYERIGYLGSGVMDVYIEVLHTEE